MFSLFIVLMITARTVTAAEPDYIEAEAPPPDSATEIKSSMDHGLKGPEAGAPMFPRVSEYLDGLPPFWRDTRLVLKPRLYNFDRKNNDAPDQVTLAAGAAIEYRSGLWLDRLGVGLTGYTAQKLHGPKDAGGLGMLRPVQTGFGVLGEAYALIDLKPHAELRLYRQAMYLPYINRHDIRVIPQTHEAFLIVQPEQRKLQWIAGHVTKIKLRNSDRFVPLSEAAGFAGTDEGASLAAVLWNLDDDTNVAVMNFQAWDFMNTTYAEAQTLVKITDGIPLSLSAQGTYQASAGDELGGDFGTYTLGARATISYRHAVVSFAGTYTDEDAGILSPFGGRPSYLSIIIANFDRAGEAAWLAGLSYNFGRFGIDGLGFDVKYVEGTVNGSAPHLSTWSLGALALRKTGRG